MQPVSVAIVGAGAWGRDLHDLLADTQEFEDGHIRCLGFLDDDPIPEAILTARGARRLGRVEDHRFLPDDVTVLIGVGVGAVRADVARRLAGRAAAPPVVHPRSHLGRHGISLGDGTAVAAFAHLSTNIRIGRHVAVHPHTTIGHDVDLADFATVFPGATVSGHVRVGLGATIGAGATVIQGVEIGDGAFVGAGACVVRDVAAGCVVSGVPARAHGAV